MSQVLQKVLALSGSPNNSTSIEGDTTLEIEPFYISLTEQLSAITVKTPQDLTEVTSSIQQYVSDMKRHPGVTALLLRNKFNSDTFIDSIFELFQRLFKEDSRCHHYNCIEAYRVSRIIDALKVPPESRLVIALTKDLLTHVKENRYWRLTHWALQSPITDDKYGILEQGIPYQEGIDTCCNRCDQTPLMTAVNLGSSELVDWILSANPQVDMEDSRGQTALMLAAEKNLPEITAHLLAGGADPCKSTTQCRNALHLSVRSSNPEILLLMIYAIPKRHREDAISKGWETHESLIHTILRAENVPLLVMMLEDPFFKPDDVRAACVYYLEHRGRSLEPTPSIICKEHGWNATPDMGLWLNPEAGSDINSFLEQYIQSPKSRVKIRKLRRV